MRMKGETFPLLIIEAQSVMLIMPPRSYPSPDTRSRTYPPLAAHPAPVVDSLTPLSPFQAPGPSVPTVTQSRQDIDSDTLATYKQPKPASDSIRAVQNPAAFSVLPLGYSRHPVIDGYL